MTVILSGRKSIETVRIHKNGKNNRNEKRFAQLASIVQNYFFKTTMKIIQKTSNR